MTKINKKIKNKKIKFQNQIKFKSYNDYKKYKKLRFLEKKNCNIPKITNNLHFNKKLKKGLFLKKPSYNEIKYPFFLNLKLINEFIKKK